MKRNRNILPSQLPIFDLKHIFSYKKLTKHNITCYYLPKFFNLTLLTNIKGKDESIAIKFPFKD